MKRIFILAFFIFAMCGFAFAQTPREVLEKVKEIKLLDATRNDVQRILVNYELDEPDYEEYYDDFSNEIADIEVSYSDGKCEENEDEDAAQIWNVGEWKATKIIIIFDDDPAPADLGFNLSEFKKQKIYPDDEDSEYAVYYNKNSGIAFVFGNAVQKIIIYPPKSGYSTLCKNKSAKEFSSAQGWFGIDKLAPVCAFTPVSVTDLILSAEEVIAGCAGEKKINRISVKTIPLNPDNDVLSYDYKISIGRIIGQGANVFWDLTGITPGTYTITAGVDNGAGVIGMTKTQTVTVKECSKPKVVPVTKQ